MKPEPLEPLSDAHRALLESLPAPKLGAAKAALWQRIEASAAATTAAGAAGAAAGAASGKIIVAAVIAGAAGLGAGITFDRVVLKPAPEVVERIVVRTETVVVPAEPPAPAPSSPSPAPKVVPAHPPPPRAEAKPAAPPPPPSSLERQLLEAARTALLKHDGEAALRALRQHAHDFPAGQFAEERDALEVQGLALAGRAVEAKQRAEVFLRNYPDSIFGPTVETVLREKPDRK